MEPSSSAVRARRRPQPVVPVHVTLTLPPTLTQDGRFLLRKGREAALYFFIEVPTQIPGRAWSLHKFGTECTAAEDYTTLVGDDSDDHQCSCPGFAWTGGCRHLVALTGLLERGELPRQGVPS